jgi:hypothetical protein
VRRSDSGLMVCTARAYHSRTCVAPPSFITLYIYFAPLADTWLNVRCFHLESSSNPLRQSLTLAVIPALRATLQPLTPPIHCLVLRSRGNGLSHLVVKRRGRYSHVQRLGASGNDHCQLMRGILSRTISDQHFYGQFDQLMFKRAFAGYETLGSTEL